MLATTSTLILVALLTWAVVVYNLLVRDRNRVAAAWSDIDVQLKRRHDLIPKLVDSVRAYAGYEQATLARVTELRERGRSIETAAERGRLEGLLGLQLQRLFVLAEAYPDLQASQAFLDLQSNVSEVESELQHARRYYNGAVRNLNIRIDSFPDLLVARLFGYRHAEYFELDDAAERHG
ncbi:MAG: LemA family protein [Gammaproteobacteria bacterium]|nr:LemA family protein [Gammaproteobacteria bacterium]